MTGPARVVFVTPEPTPYRSPLFDRIAARPEIDLFVVYAAASVQGRRWTVEPAHPHVVLAGRRLALPGGLLPHDYPVDPAVWRVLTRRSPDVVAVTGWSTFASQAAVVWARTHGVPYLVAAESHGHEPRAGWRLALKRLVVPQVLRPAAGVLVTGALAREHALAYGADPRRLDVLANTVDVDALGRRVDDLSGRRDALRSRLGVAERGVLVLSVARLAPEKGLDTLADAVAGVPGARLAIAGEGPLRPALERRDVTLLGQLDAGALLEAYAAADVFALLSRREPWGVVVNEAAAAGLPLVLSDRVGAAHDLLRPGENGELVPPDDVPAAVSALAALAADAGRRERAGRRSRELVAGWGYEPSVEAFVRAVSSAVR